MRKPTIWVPARSDTSRAVQSQRIVRDCKFWIYCTIHVGKTKALISFVVTAKRICAFCFRLCRLLVSLCSSYVSRASCPSLECTYYTYVFGVHLLHLCLWSAPITACALNSANMVYNMHVMRGSRGGDRGS